MDDMLKEALRLRAMGFAIHWLQPRSKAPVQSNWSNVPVMTAHELKRSYRAGLNLGFRPGKWSVVDGQEICTLDVDIRGGEPFAKEAYAAAEQMIGDADFSVASGSGVGRHRLLSFDIGKSPGKAATTLRQSDVWINRTDGSYCDAGVVGADPAWLIEILSTGKNVVLPPSIHPNTGKPYQWI